MDGLSSQCCHLLLCDTAVPFSQKCPKFRLAGDMCPRGCLHMGTFLSPCISLAFCMLRGTMLLSCPSPRCPGFPPPQLLFHLIFIPPSPPSPFVFLTSSFLTDKRVLSEPKSHRKCSFHGHFVSLQGVCFGFVLSHPWQGSPAAGLGQGGKREQLKPTPKLVCILNHLLCFQL